MAGATRKSVSFGSGATGNGRSLMGPRTGGAVTAGDAPPAPTARALGPHVGGAAGPTAVIPSGHPLAGPVAPDVGPGAVGPRWANADGVSATGPGTPTRNWFAK